MANRLRQLRFAAGALILGAAGCAFPNGGTGGDPLLGSFNRPIVPTPPPERGGLGPDTPAYDGGARIGVGAPDVPATTETGPAPLTPPAPAPGTSTSPGVPASPGSPPSGAPGSTPGSPPGARLPIAGSDDSISYQPTSGARLPVLQIAKDSTATLPAPAPLSPGLLPHPGELPSPPIRPAGHETDGPRGQTIEEMQALLHDVGARGMKVERAPDGEWVFDCTIKDEAYQGRGRSALEAVRLILDLIKSKQ